MEKLFLTACLIASFMYGSLAQEFSDDEEYGLRKPGEREIEACLENDLKDFRMELERLNVTHEIPGICSVCKWVLGKAIPQVSGHVTKRGIRSLLNQACGSYVFFGWVCRKFVNGYFDIIYNDIASKHMNVPRLICKAMHLCWWPAGPQKKHKQMV